MTLRRLPTTAPMLTTALTLSLVLALAACGNSRLNPLNWFGRSEARDVVEEDGRIAKDGRLLVSEVLSLHVEQMPGGAIIRAEGLTPTQGWWQADLVPRPLDENGVLVFDFRILPPMEPTPVSTPQSRQVAVAHFLSANKLAAVTEIVVQGDRNARATRR